MLRAAAAEMGLRFRQSAPTADSLGPRFVSRWYKTRICPLAGRRRQELEISSCRSLAGRNC